MTRHQALIPATEAAGLSRRMSSPQGSTESRTALRIAFGMARADTRGMTATQNSSGQPYRVHKGGPRVWYIQEVVTGELKALPFRAKRDAQTAVDEWNERRTQPKRPNLTVVR